MMFDYASRYETLIKGAAELWDNKEYYDKKIHYDSIDTNESQGNKVKNEFSMLKNFMDKKKRG